MVLFVVSFIMVHPFFITQTRGHMAEPSLSSPLRLGPCYFVVNILQPSHPSLTRVELSDAEGLLYQYFGYAFGRVTYSSLTKIERKAIPGE